MVWLGLTICWRRTSERNLSVGLLHALSFVSRGVTKSWVGQVASRSPIYRHVFDATVSLDVKATRNEFLNGSMVLLFSAAPSSIEIPYLRVPRYRLAPVDCFLSSSVTGKAPC